VPHPLAATNGARGSFGLHCIRKARPAIDTLLRTALVRRLGEQLDATVDPLRAALDLPNQGLPQRAMTGLRLGTLAPRTLLDTLGLAREGLDYGSKVGTGALGVIMDEALRHQNLAQPVASLVPGVNALGPLLALGLADKIANLGPLKSSDYRSARAAFDQSGGNIVGKLRAANEGLARESPLATGLVNIATDPTSYLTGGASEAGRAAQQGDRIARGLGLSRELVDQLLNPEGQIASAIGGRLARTGAGQAARRGLTESALTNMLRERYSSLLTLAPERRDYAAYAKELGLPMPGGVGVDPNQLVPEGRPNIKKMARQAQARAAAEAQPALAAAEQLPLGAAEQLPLAENPPAAPLDLARQLLRSGDQGRDLVYAPADPAFWERRLGVAREAVPDLLNQLQQEGSLGQQGDELVNLLRVGRGGAREAAPAAGPLSPDELDRLVNAAYPTADAQANAILKYRNPDDLTEAALNRLGQNPDTIQNFARQNPDLAQRLVDLPDPRMATPGQLDELLPGGDTLGATPGLTPGGAGRWLTRDLIQGLPGINRIGVSGSGAALGAATGGLAPAEDDEQRRQNALQGAAIGAGLGLGATTGAGRGIIRQLPKIGETARTLGGEAWQAQREAMARPSKGLRAIGYVPNVWTVQTTSTLRNLLQSLGSSALWLKDGGIQFRAFRENMAGLTDLYNRGVRKPYDAQPTMTTDILDALGKTGRELQLGKTFTDLNRNMLDELSAIDTGVAEAGLSLANPLYGGVPLFGVAAKGVQGFFRPAIQKVYNTLDNFIEAAARHAAWQDEVEKALPVAAGDFLSRHGLVGALPADGRFSVADVAKVAGEATGKEWDRVAEKVIALGERRAKDILGDFGDRSLAERAASRAVPFIGWAIRAYPRTLKMALDHPGASIALMMLMYNAAEGAKESGLPGYQVGTVPVDPNIPVFGGIARELLGGQPGEMRVNLQSALSPFGASILEPDELPDNPTGYQQAKNALGRTGFSFNPIVQALMYATNQDFTKPGALSRTATGETVLPGPTVPSIAAGPLNKAREAAGGSVSTATPHDRRLAEIYYRETGHVIDDPTNMQDPTRRALLLSTLDPNSPIRQQTDEEMRRMGVAKLGVSLASPVTATARSDQQAATQRARAELGTRPPAKYEQGAIRAVERGGKNRDLIEAYLMEQANRGTQGDLPADLTITRGASGQDRAATIMEAFQNQLYGGGYYQNYLLERLLGLR
jgi:hypothetical protein